MADSDEETEPNRRRLVASDFDLFAEKLLKHSLLLTALELHTELVEVGQEIPRLRDFFSNPGNFERQYLTTSSSRDALTSTLPRTSSVTTIDSLDDYTRYSEDGARDTDEKVAVLEFELRKAHEMIKALRGSLTEATETETPATEGSKGDRSENEHTSSGDSLRPHEKRALNFLVNEYLLKNGYRMTSVTFSDENADQDFEDWDDVGLNTAKPPDLLHLYRDYGHHTVPEVMLVLQAVKEEKTQLEAEHAKLLKECKQLQEEIGELRYENHTLTETVGKLESERKEMANTSQQTEAGSESLLQNTVIMKLDSNNAVVTSEEFTTDTDANNQKNEEANIAKATEDISENESQSPVGMEASDECVDVEYGTGLVAADTESENSQENSADVSTESTQEKHDDSQNSPMPPSSPGEKSAERKDESSRMMSSCFRNKLLAFTHVQLDNRLSNEVCKLSNADENAVVILARCLPHIVPNVLLNKREELIPVILCSAIHHPEAKERDNLLHMLFNLIKRPDEDQRQMIMSGCAAFAQVVDPTRIEAELLPQWWEQIGHKYVERRLLVAEACGGLAPYLPDYIRSSLVWSMLKQMLSDDRNEAVREAVTKSLALVVAFIENADKYEQAYELLMDTLFDSSEKVAKTSMEVFLSSFASWSQDLGKLESHLLTSLITDLENTLKDFEQVQDLSMESEDIERVQKTLETIQVRLPRCIQVVTSLIPVLFVTVLRTGPFAKKPEDVERYNVPVAPDRFLSAASPLTDVETILGGSQAVAYHVRRFDKHVSEDQFDSWDSLSWIHFECLPNLCKIVGHIPVTMTECVQQFISLFRSLCITFGGPYTYKKIKPFCMDRLNVLTLNLKDEKRERLLSSAALPVLAAGVLGCFDSEEDMSELTSLLRHSVIALAEASAPLDGPIIMFQELSTLSRYHQLLIGVLWQIVVHSEANVRSSAAPLFTVLIKGVDLDLISRQVLPALVTLASDSQMSVRTASIPAFAAIVENVTDKMILEKVYVQFQSFLEDPQYKDQHELQTTMIRAFGKVAPHAEPHFRDEVLLPRLVVMATINNQLHDEYRRREIALELMEAYVSLTCCFISIDVLNDYIIPGLRAVKQDIEVLAPDCEETVLVLLKECETKVEQRSFPNLPAGSKIGQEIKSTFMSGFHRLKDAPRPKMADIFKKKDRFDS